MTILVYFETSEADLGAVMSAIAPVLPSVTNLRVETMLITGEPESGKVRRKSVARNSKVRDAIMGVLADGAVHTYAEVEKALVDAGCNPNSASPGVTVLCEAGKVIRLHGKKLQLLELGLAGIDAANPGLRIVDHQV